MTPLEKRNMNQKITLEKLKELAPFDFRSGKRFPISHIGIRRSGGGNDGYFWFDVYEKEEMSVVIEYVKQFEEYLRKKYETKT